jgi:hypothetical protein
MEEIVRHECILAVIMRINSYKKHERWEGHHKSGYQKRHERFVHYKLVKNEREPTARGGASHHEGHTEEECHNYYIFVESVSDVEVVIEYYELHNRFNAISKTSNHMHVIKLV